MNLELQGWNTFFEEQFARYKKQGVEPGRVLAKKGDSYFISNECQVMVAKLTGTFRYDTKQIKDYPVVGDWVVIEKLALDSIRIQAVLKRQNAFVRKLPISGGRKLKNGVIDGGKTEEQVVAANIDVAFIVVGLDNNFDLPRIERYLTLSYTSHVTPVIILNKVDLSTTVTERITQVKEIARNVPIHVISAEKGINMNVFADYLSQGCTVVFLGSSGVGKSTITNYLLGEETRKKQAISKTTGKGKHTTTSAELLYHPSGGMIIDTPGLRELQLWGEEEVLEHSFTDIVETRSLCKFSDCTHTSEPGCAIRQALEEGVINKRRYDSYKKQLSEIQTLDKKKRQLTKQLNKRMKQNLRNREV